MQEFKRFLQCIVGGPVALFMLWATWHGTQFLFINALPSFLVHFHVTADNADNIGTFVMFGFWIGVFCWFISGLFNNGTVEYKKTTTVVSKDD